MVVGLISVFAIVISQGIIEGQVTTGWPPVLVSIVTNIAPVIGIVGIIAMFIIVVNLITKSLATLCRNIEAMTPLSRGSLIVIPS